MRLFCLMVWMLMLMNIGCSTRRPGQEWPWVAESKAEDDVIYHGVGFRF